ncbi:hypothetical protein R3P38DRAFT_3249776 [Favolaschia claudopus]|uniref:Uncharacterized protein n=1 Tax=Favolaschia claudopus TaxID=2862362 RepID=A0AAW0EHI6_9AGAR
MSFKRTGSNVSTSSPAPRNKNARVSSRVISDAALFEVQGEELQDEEFMTGFPSQESLVRPPDGIDEVDEPASSSAGLAASPNPSSSRQKENTAHDGPPKAKRNERHLSNKNLNSAQTEQHSSNSTEKGKGRALDSLPLLLDEVDDSENHTFLHPGRKYTAEDATALVTRMWTIQVQDLHSWACDARAALQALTSTVDRLQDVHAAGAKYQHIHTLSTQHPVYNGLAPRTRNFFLNIASGKPSSAIAEGIESGALCTPEACAWRYVTAYPADLAWGVSTLLALGLELEAVKQRLLKLAAALKLDADGLTLLLECLSATAFPSTPDFGLYFGVTDNQTPRDRLDQDLKEQHTRFSNWAKVNADFVTWEPYYLTDLMLPASTGLRTDSVAGDTEVFAITVSGPHGFNRAVGGFIPKFLPSPAASTIIAGWRQSPSVPFGVDLAQRLTAKVTAFLQDQKHYLQNHVAAVISDQSFKSVVQNGPGVFRRRGSAIPGIRFLETITLEDFQARRGSQVVGGLWSSTAGRALKSFRYIISTLYPDIPPDGDLDPSTIASRLGPTFDMWPLTTSNVHFWPHCLFASRLLITTDAVVTCSWSEVVDSIFSGGYLHLAWRGVPADIQEAFLKGHTPSNIQDFLPSTPSKLWTPPKTSAAAYLDKVGVIRIVRYGPHRNQLIIYISNLHTGGIKHDPASAHDVHNIITSVELLNRMALDEVRVMEEEGMVLDRQTGSEEDVWSFLEAVVSRTNAKAEACGLRKELDEQKSRYQLLVWAQGHLRSIGRNTSGATKARSPDFRIPGVTHTVGDPNSTERDVQFDELRLSHEELSRGGAEPDPFHLVPFEYRDSPFGEGMRVWFLERGEDIQISNSTRTTGKTQLAYDNAMASRKALSNNKPALSLGGTKGTATARSNREAAEDPKVLLIQCLEELAKWYAYTRGLSKVTGSRWSDGWRWGHCPLCGALIISRDRNTKHACVVGAAASVIQDQDHKSLQVLNNVHDVLRVPELAALVEGCINHLRLIKLCAFDILCRPENMQIREKQLPGIDMEATKSIFVWKTNSERDGAWWEVTLAVDACLKLVSTCPRHLWPTQAANRGLAWSHEGTVTKWEPGKGRHFVQCFEDYNAVLQPQTRSGGRLVFIHVCDHTRRAAVARGKRAEDASDESKREGGPQDCSSDPAMPMDKHEIRSRVDLPPDHLRSRWYFERVFPKLDWVAGANSQASSSKPKKGKNKGKKK